MASTNLVLDTGRVALVNALARGDRVRVGRARIGSAINFEPIGSGISPSPTTVYTIPNNFITVNIVNTDQIRFSVNFTEDMGDFDLGNIMLDLQVNNTFIPFVWWVSDVVIPKQKFTPDVVGNRFIVSFIVEFVNFADAISITVTSPVFASLPSYGTQLTLPPVSTALFQQQVIQQHTETLTPALATRRSADSKYFGFPFLQRLDHPFFGILEGGFARDGYAPYPGNIYWGGYFPTSTDDYISRVEGGGFVGSTFNDTIICDTFSA